MRGVGASIGGYAVWLTGRSVDVSGEIVHIGGVISTIWRGVVRRFRGSFGELYNCGIESYKLEHNGLLISCSELDYVNV